LNFKESILSLKNYAPKKQKYISGGKWCIPCLSKWTLFCRTPSAITTPLKEFTGEKFTTAVLLLSIYIKKTRSLDQLDINRKIKQCFSDMYRRDANTSV